MQCLNISIIDDNVVLEGNETFTVILTAVDTVILRGNMTTITITDNGRANFLATSSTVKSLKFRLELSFKNGLSICVHV